MQGYKQRGPEAVRATNVFYYLTYEGSINLDAIESPSLRESVEAQILSFGQTPAQLMTDPHPPRHSIQNLVCCLMSILESSGCYLQSPMMFTQYGEDLCMLMKFISNSPIVYIAANTYPQTPAPTVVTIAQNLVFALNRWNTNYQRESSIQKKCVKQNVAETASQSGNSLGSSIPATPDKSADTPTHADLPLTVDPLLAVGNPSQPPARRHLGDALDQKLDTSWANFVTTVDSRSIIACGYPDYSLRVIDTETGTILHVMSMLIILSSSAAVRQALFGHNDVVTCIARSESNLHADCYVASGSKDCMIVLWHFSAAHATIIGEYATPGETPTPRAILTGHDSEITAICVSAEHGLVLSGARGLLWF